METRHEEYRQVSGDLPFVLHVDLKRSRFNRSENNNWHENLEIQLCTGGEGTVLLDSERYPFRKNDIIVVNSNSLHHTGTDTELTYSCLIVGIEFCKQMGIDPNGISFEPIIKSPRILSLFENLIELYLDKSAKSRIARLNKLTLEILIELAEHHAAKKKNLKDGAKKFETVKAAISFIRENYSKKITLDDISKAVLYDKYALCREFKRLTGQTLVENLNSFRCIKAVDCLSRGLSVADAAALSGFENLSFFTKTFKRYIGKLPSEYKTRVKNEGFTV